MRVSRFPLWAGGRLHSVGVCWHRGLLPVAEVELRMGLWEPVTLETALLTYAAGEGIGLNSAWIVVGCMGMDALVSEFPEEDSWMEQGESASALVRPM